VPHAHCSNERVQQLTKRKMPLVLNSKEIKNGTILETTFYALLVNAKAGKTLNFANGDCSDDSAKL